MKATEAKLLAFLKKSPQFVIPIYQRTYSWTEEECEQLWDDILRAGHNEHVAVHFIGSIVYIEGGLSQVSHQAPLLVIDGQQRLTTVSLLLAALARVLGDGEPIDGFSPRKVRNYYLLNPEEDGDRHYKLLLSQTDKESLMALVGDAPKPKNPSLRIEQNYAFFEKRLASLGEDLTAVCNGLAKLVVVDIALSRDQDNPQLIFESMNSTGRELTQADLIRNFVLMGLEPELQTRLYQHYWRPMEEQFGQEAYSTHFDSFMRHYLTVKTGDIPRIDDVYNAFKNYARKSGRERVNFEKLVADLREHARYYCNFALGHEQVPELKQAFQDLRELKVDTAFPLLLELYGDYAEGVLSEGDLIDITRLIEAYVFRRAICAIPTNSLNKTFATFGRGLKKSKCLESVKAHFLGMKSYRRFPRDEEFCREIQNRDLYNFRSRSYFLRRLENHNRKERVTVNDYTIEHIMPQSEDLPRHWREELGPDWEHIHQTWLHTLGNLTLTGYNSEYSNRSFSEKRDMPGGFAESPLRVNAGIAQEQHWNEEAIKSRAQRLAVMAAEVWKMPELPEQELRDYEVSSRRSATYSIEDHLHLTRGHTKDLFEAFRRQVLALDAGVTEEFLKLYVAYKAETNFVDVVPQAGGLRLSLNMRFPEVDDPRGICRDVTRLGRWGNGDVELRLTDQKDLPYVIGLVRQSLERQLGGEVNA